MYYGKKTTRANYFWLLFIIFLTFSCSLKTENESDPFSKESIYNSPEKRKKYDFFSQEFKVHWRKAIYEDYTLAKHDSTEFDDPKLLYILPNETWDTVIFYAVWKYRNIDKTFSIEGRPI